MARNFYFNGPIHEATKIVEAPEVEPITLAEAKKQCRVDADITNEDDLIEQYISAARYVVEARARRAFITQTRQVELDSFPMWRNWSLVGSPITLPSPPVQQVNSVKYLNGSGELITLDEALYTVDTTSEPARITHRQGQPWPSAGFYPGAVQIEYICGFGDNAEDVPANYRQAIALLTGHYFRCREAVGDAGAELPFGVQALIDAGSYGGYW